MNIFANEATHKKAISSMKIVQTFGTTLAVCLLGMEALGATESCRTDQQRTATAEQGDTVCNSEYSLVVKGAFTENDTLFFNQSDHDKQDSIINALDYIEACSLVKGLEDK